MVADPANPLSSTSAGETPKRQESKNALLAAATSSLESGGSGTGSQRFAAGIRHRRIYDCRHSYATWSLAAGVSLFTLSRRMGTSLAMIDAHYGHLAPDAEQQERLLLDGYDERLDRDTESFGH